MMATQGVQQKQKRTRAESENIASAIEKRAQFKPVVVTGIGPGKLVTVKASEFGRLDVDPAYQRGRTNMVNQIVRAIQAGGAVLDPVTLCMRPDSDRLWIIDGYQRVCAFQQTKTPFQAMLHESDSGEAEHEFFIAMNSKRAVSANVIVKAWTGPSGTLLRKSNESMEHPLYERINFTQSNSDSKFSASTLVTGLKSVVGADRTGGRVEVHLSRLDMAMQKRMNVARAEHYLRLIGKVCDRGSLPAMVVRALGIVASERWTDDVTMPPLKVIERLRAKNWAADVVLVEKYMPVLLEQMRKVWKA
jgi:hypothetical protein